MEVARSILPVAAAIKVASQFSVVVIEPIGMEGFERLGNSLMQAAPSLHEQRAVRHLLGQRVLEGVFDLAHRRLLVYELAQLQML
jgi:hypothetical protein